MDGWVVFRPNVGTSRTAKGKYRQGRRWEWNCDGQDRQQVREYRREVAPRIEQGVHIGGEEPDGKTRTTAWADEHGNGMKK